MANNISIHSLRRSAIISRLIALLIAACLSFSFCFAQEAEFKYVSTPADKALADSVMALAHDCGKADLASRMMCCAEALLGTPYVGGTLDNDWKGEELRVFLTKTDCILFVETCLNLARTSYSEDCDFEDFVRHIAQTRYRRSEMPYSYSDRIHYTTEWIRRQEGSTLKDITLELGGKSLEEPINFMSTHSDKYPMLSDTGINPSASKDLKAIKEVEAMLNREYMTYIPKAKVASIQGKIHSGDIICYVSSVKGLDIAHVAIACVRNGRVGFIHASMNEGKVVLDKKTIADYVMSRSNLSGIKVVRPL